MKRCSKCKIEKKITEFYSRKASADGRRSACKKCHSAHYKANKKEITVYKKAHYKKNRDKLIAYARAYRKQNKDKVNAYDKLRYKKNRKEKIIRTTKWRRNNPHKVREYEARNRAKRLLRRPKWANISAICNFYLNCPPGHEVDHIIPLCGKNVSGLDIIENLQYLPKKKNRKKSNRF